MSASKAVSFVTLGCAKNEVDTDKMQARLKAAGFTVEPDLNRADLVIVNTCAFLASAVEESLEVIFDIASQKNAQGNDVKVLVAGCLPSRYGDELSNELVEAAGFLEARDEESVVEAVQELLGVDADEPREGHDERYAQPVSAYVKISDGCDRFCSYCMIPYIRGRYRSFELESIEAEIDELVSKGVREIVLIGQDTGIWGRDLEEPSNTAALLAELASKFPDTWFRVMYLQPEGIDDELLDAIASHENICSYIDMPLQHCNAEVLRRMNRTGDESSYLDLIARLRERIPGIKLRTTLMAAFPGETEEQFEQLVDFVDDAMFDYAGVFAYSPEEGSAAFDFDGLLDDDERLQRAQVLLDACEAVGTARIAGQVGDVVDVLVEGFEETDAGLEAVGRTQGQAPDVDGQVHVVLDPTDSVTVGDIVPVKLTGSFFYELEGEIIHND